MNACKIETRVKTFEAANSMKRSNFGILLIFFILVPAILTGCGEKMESDGVVAKVNGEAIHLHSVQAILDSRSSLFGLNQKPSLSGLKNNYGNALGTLIVYTLIRQELAKHGQAVDDQAIENMIEQMRDDFGEESLENFMIEVSLRESDLRNLIRDHLSLEKFKKNILLQKLNITADDIKSFYDKHRKDLALPDNAEVCFIYSSNKDEIAMLCSNFKENQKQYYSNINIYCQTVNINTVSEDLWQEITSTPVGKCGKIRSEKENYHAVAVRNTDKARQTDIVEIYPVIEKILLEEKKDQVFDSWLSEAIANSSIYVSQELMQPLLSVEAQKNSSWED